MFNGNPTLITWYYAGLLLLVTGIFVTLAEANANPRRAQVFALLAIAGSILIAAVIGK